MPAFLQTSFNTLSNAASKTFPTPCSELLQKLFQVSPLSYFHPLQKLFTHCPLCPSAGVKFLLPLILSSSTHNVSFSEFHWCLTNRRHISFPLGVQCVRMMILSESSWVPQIFILLLQWSLVPLGNVKFYHLGISPSDCLWPCDCPSSSVCRKAKTIYSLKLQLRR